MSTLTRWFTIDVDGQPVRPGWYDILYAWESECFSRAYWDGKAWMDDEQPDSYRLSFGNEDTEGERWRGLTEEAK